MSANKEAVIAEKEDRAGFCQTIITSYSGGRAGRGWAGRGGAGRGGAGRGGQGRMLPE